LQKLDASLVNGKPDPSGFNQRDEDADHEIEVLGGGITRRRRQVDTAAAEEPIQLAFLLHHHGRQGPMKHSNGYAQQQSGDFYDHRDVV